MKSSIQTTTGIPRLARLAFPVLMEFRVTRGQKSMVIQVTGENSNSDSKSLPLFIFRHNFKQYNNQFNIYKCFANKQIDIFYYIAENSYKKIMESTLNMFFLLPSVF